MAKRILHQGETDRHTIVLKDKEGIPIPHRFIEDIEITLRVSDRGVIKFNKIGSEGFGELKEEGTDGTYSFTLTADQTLELPKSKQGMIMEILRHYSSAIIDGGYRIIDKVKLYDEVLLSEHQMNH